METIFLQPNTPIPAEPCVATVGFFDGVHRGHQFLVSQVIAEARAAAMQSVVITFDRHPRQVLHQDYQPELLSTMDSKLEQLSLTGIDRVVVLHFDVAMAGLTAHDFMAQVLRDRLNVRKLVIGYDNRFGHNRTEGFDDYKRYGEALGIDVIQNRAFRLGDIQVSSSVIRKLIKEGRLEQANECLGRPYAVSGEVVGGFRQGRKMGFPTANLDAASSAQLILPNGVYAVSVRLEHHVGTLTGMTNIGTRPTFDGTNRSIETHIFDFEGNLYGNSLQLAFLHRIREERKFSGPDELALQLKADQEKIKQLFKKDISL